MPSASTPALSRVVSPKSTHLCCCLRWGSGGGGRGGGSGCNRLVTSIDELALVIKNVL